MSKNNIMREEMRKALVREVATHYVETQSTIRSTAKIFGKSKSWVHRILKIEISQKCPELKEDVMKAIQFNKDARAKRGGQGMAMAMARRRKQKELGGN